jgi:glycosyltransferase involved in cell wall biosynthesis
VVDANPTPFGPPNRLTPREQRLAIERLAGAFDGLRGRGHRRSSRSRRDTVRVSIPTDKTVCVTDSSRPALTVVVVARNEGSFVRSTVAQLCDTLAPPNEIVLVDDGSDDGSIDGLEEAYPRVHLIRSRGLGVAHGRNLGASRSTGRVIVFADAHLSIPAGWCEPLVAAVSDPAVGGAAPAIANLERAWQRGYGLRFTGFDLDVEWLPRLGDESYAVPLMPWCFGAMRREVFDSTGGFDTGMIQWGSIDNEMSVRLWSLGYALKVVPGIEVAHFFRDERPYPIEWTPVVHNRLRLAFVHFEADRIAAVVRALEDYPEFHAAIAQAVTGDVSERRKEVASRRVRDTGWLFNDFEQERDNV